MAYSLGTYVATMLGENGKIVTEQGKWLSVWKRQAEWHLAYCGRHDASVYALDSVTTDLCRSLCDGTRLHGFLALVRHASSRRVLRHARQGRRGCAARLRRIRFKDSESGKMLVFLTNNTSLSALAIDALFKSRWQVELFFRWIRQHLRIKRFPGNSENAVKTQIWCAVSTYVLIAIVQRGFNLRPRCTPEWRLVHIAVPTFPPLLGVDDLDD